MTIYLSGCVRGELGRRHDTGYMLTPHMGNRPDLSETHWGADNGCFSRPDAYRHDKYLAWLDERKGDAARCLFATAPDVVGDAVATLERSLDELVYEAWHQTRRRPSL